MKKLVIIESRYAGDVEGNVRYAKAAMLDSFQRGESPIAFHLLHTQDGILNDQTPEERELGISSSLEWYRGADLCAVYTDLGISTGMVRGIEAAKKAGVPVERRTLPNLPLTGR